VNKSAMIRARVDPELKEDVEHILSQLGLTTTQAITLFYQQVKWYRGLPFEIRIPNQTTVETFEDTDKGEKIVHCQTPEEMFERLNI
jgi:DNA-damage-inducible protein J